MNIKCYDFSLRDWVRWVFTNNEHWWRVEDELSLEFEEEENWTHLTKVSTLLSRPVGSPCSLWQDCQVCQEDPPEPLLSTNQRPRPKQGGLWLVGWSTGGKQLRSRRINPWKVRGNPGNQVVRVQARMDWSSYPRPFPKSFCQVAIPPLKID